MNRFYKTIFGELNFQVLLYIKKEKYHIMLEKIDTNLELEILEHKSGFFFIGTHGIQMITLL